MKFSISLVFLCACALYQMSMMNSKRPPKVKKLKPINWNHSYYSGRFGHCKKLRVFDPVEMVRAQAWATAAFRKCGPKLVVKYASKYNFPAFGLQKVINLLCLYFNLVFAYIANDGTVVIPKGTKTVVFINITSAFVRMMRKINFTVVARYRRQKAFITYEMADEYLTALSHCLLDTQYFEQPDCDYFKHLADHYKYILL